MHEVGITPRAKKQTIHREITCAALKLTFVSAQTAADLERGVASDTLQGTHLAVCETGELCPLQI